MEKNVFDQGIPAFKLFEITGLCSSGSEARRLIDQGGAYLNKGRLDKFDLVIRIEDFNQKGELLLRSGKKKFHRIRLLDKK